MSAPLTAPITAPAGVPQRLPLHPGRFLERHYLAPLAMSQTEAARRLGISRRRLNELIQGHRGMTPDTAIRCALAFGLPVTEWLALQADWDSFQTWKSLRRQVPRVDVCAPRGSAASAVIAAATGPTAASHPAARPA